MIQLSEHFTYKKLLRFTLPSVIMLVFTSLYGVVDGFFVSNFVGKEAFTAVNFIMPFLLVLGSVGFLFGTGGSALIAKTIGEGEPEKANRIFSFLVYTSIVCGLLFCGLGIAILRPITILLGAEGELLENSVRYGFIILIALPAYVLQYEFQCLFATAEKPKLGLYVTLAAGITNIILDVVFVAWFRWGIEGAAVATVLGQCVGGIFPIIYFARPNSSLLSLGKTRFDGKALLKTVTNGSSELMANISMSVVSMLYNAQLLKYAGEDGVAAYGVLMYVSMIFISIFIGYSVGMSPIVSYHFGAQNHGELKSVLKKNLILISIFSVLMFGAAELLASPIAGIFVSYDEGLLKMTYRAFLIFSFSFLFTGFTIMGSSFFTALNSGIWSAFIAFMRTLVFQIVAVFTFPLIWGLDGIWLSIVGAEVMAIIVTLILLVCNRKRFHY